MNNYPPGAEYDLNAPWKETKNSDVEVEVWASNTLSRAALITVNDYKELPPDAETDEDGHVTYYPNRDFSECDITNQFKNQYYTIKEIFNSLQLVVNDINDKGLTDQNLHILNRLATECTHWNVDEEEVVFA